MTRDETLVRLRDLQRQAQELRQGTDSPTLERTMQLFDMYCHIARWELGDVDGFSDTDTRWGCAAAAPSRREASKTQGRSS